MFSLGIKIFQTNIIKVLLKKCYGPALKAPSSDQSVRPSVHPFLEHLYSQLTLFCSYLIKTELLIKVCSDLEPSTSDVEVVVEILEKSLSKAYLLFLYGPIWIKPHPQSACFQKVCSDPVSTLFRIT